MPETLINGGEGGIRTHVPAMDKTISSRSRYDLFDTSPYILTVWKNKVYFNTKSKTKSLLIL